MKQHITSIDRKTEKHIVWSLVDMLSMELGDCVIYKLHRNGRYYQFAHKNKQVHNRQQSHMQVNYPLILSKSHGVVGRAADRMCSQVVEDTSTDDDYIVDDDYRNSECAIPIIVDDVVHYILDSEHPTKGFYSIERVNLMQQFGYLLAESTLQRSSLRPLEKDLDWDNFYRIEELALRSTLSASGRDLILHSWKLQLGKHFVY